MEKKDSNNGHKKDNSNPNSGKSISSSVTICWICKKEITDLAITDPCYHRFCYQCLNQSSTKSDRCPECRVVFTNILHNIKAENSYDESPVSGIRSTTNISRSGFGTAARLIPHHIVQQNIHSAGTQDGGTTFGRHPKSYDLQKLEPKSSAQPTGSGNLNRIRRTSSTDSRILANPYVHHNTGQTTELGKTYGGIFLRDSNQKNKTQNSPQPSPATSRTDPGPAVPVRQTPAAAVRDQNARKIAESGTETRLDVFAQRIREQNRIRSRRRRRREKRRKQSEMRSRIRRMNRSISQNRVRSRRNRRRRRRGIENSRGKSLAKHNNHKK